MSALADANETAERLRSKHIRTLEVLQKLVDENKILKAALEGKGLALPGPGAGVPDDSAQVAELQDELARAQEHIKELEASVVDSHEKDRKLAEVQATFKSKIDRMAEQVRSAHRLTDDMVQRVKELEQENIKLKGDVVLRELPRRTEAETQLGVEGDGDVRVHVPAPSEDLRKVNAELEAQVQALRSDLEAAMAPDDGDAAMKAKLAHAASLLDAANAEIERLRADAERAGEDRDTAFRRAEDLRDALNATTAARDDAEARVGQADARVAHLEEDNALLRRQLNAAVARCKQLMSEADEKKSSGFKTRDFAHHVTLTKENQLLRAQVQSMKDERKRFMSKVRSGRLGT